MDLTRKRTIRLRRIGTAFMAVRSHRDNPPEADCPRIYLLVVWAALALALALPAAAPAAEGGALEVRCEGNTLSLEARDAPVTDVFRALEEECGLLLGGLDFIPERPVTATYEKATLEEVVEDLILLADLPNTVHGRGPSGKLRLAVLPTGTPAPKAIITRFEPEAERDPEEDLERIREFALEIARDKFKRAKTDEEQQRALEELRRFSFEEAEELTEERLEAALDAAEQKLDLAKTEEERQQALAELRQLDPRENQEGQEEEDQIEAALEEALQQYELAKTDEERQAAYEAVEQLDPDEAEELREDEEEED